MTHAATFLLAHRPVWAILAGCVAVGYCVGYVFFRALWWSVRRLTQGGSGAIALATTLARFALLVCLLTLAARHGTSALVSAGIGILIARFVALYRFRGTAS